MTSRNRRGLHVMLRMVVGLRHEKFWRKRRTDVRGELKAVTKLFLRIPNTLWVRVYGHPALQVISTSLSRCNLLSNFLHLGKGRRGCSLSSYPPNDCARNEWSSTRMGDATETSNALVLYSLTFSCCNATAGQGGVTPSIGDVEGALLAVKGSRTRVHVLIRPRPGDFVYSALEKQVMLCVIAGRNAWKIIFILRRTSR